jgi:hypothetical protein
MQDVTVTARLQSTGVQAPPSTFKCNVLRESLSVESQNISCATLKRRGSWVSLYISDGRCPTCIRRSGAECFRLLGPDNRDLFAHQRVSDIPERIS